MVGKSIGLVVVTPKYEKDARPPSDAVALMFQSGFIARRFTIDGAGTKTKNGIVTIKHNGTIIHENLELTSATPGGGFSKEIPVPGPIQLQQHGNPVFYRNVWVVEK